MKAWQVVTAGLLVAGLLAAVFWAGARRPGAWLTSERPSEAEQAPGVQTPGPSEAHPGTPRPEVARPAPSADVVERAAPAGKGHSLFEGEPLLRPEVAASTEGALARADQGAQARALSPRAERRLAALRAKLATATGERRQHLQIMIESLENNLEHRRERERLVPGESSRY